MMFYNLIEILLHFDNFIFLFVEKYGFLSFLFIFLIIFIETGIVIFPFLPGDSLLFALGILANLGKINFFYVFFVVSIAAIFGDTLNYYIGNKFGKYILDKKWINKKHFDYSYNLYKKHGGKIIIYSRFIPLVRTFAPFVAGGSKMDYSKFILFNIFGAILWTIVFLLVGYFLGNVPIIKENIFLTVLGIVLFSIFLPILIKPIKSIYRRKNSK